MLGLLETKPITAFYVCFVDLTLFFIHTYDGSQRCIFTITETYEISLVLITTVDRYCNLTRTNILAANWSPLRAALSPSMVPKRALCRRFEAALVELVTTLTQPGRSRPSPSVNKLGNLASRQN